MSTPALCQRAEAPRAPYSVSGMTCGGCANKVTDHVEQIDGVSDVSVDIPNGRLTVSVTPTVTDDAVHAAIEQDGYTVAASA